MEKAKQERQSRLRRELLPVAIKECGESKNVVFRHTETSAIQDGGAHVEKVETRLFESMPFLLNDQLDDK